MKASLSDNRIDFGLILDGLNFILHPSAFVL